VSTKTLKGTVENKIDATNTLFVSVKNGNFYTVTQINNIGENGGPTLTGATDFDVIKIGQSVQVAQVWHFKPEATQPPIIKTNSVKALQGISAL
jgi:hypothetical protein